MYNPYKSLPTFNNLTKKADTQEPVNKPTISLKQLKELCTPSQKWLDKCLNDHPSYIELEELNSTGQIEIPFWVVGEAEREEYMKTKFNTYKPHVQDPQLLSTAVLECTTSYYEECSKFYEQKVQII
jgi:hypothetical protein